MTIWTFDTQSVVGSRSGTGWTIDVTSANLDEDLTLKDFVVLFDSVVQSNTNFNKTTRTSITYVGSSIGTTNVEIRRRTPQAPAKIVKYGERFASDDWNREMNRVSRRAAEWEAFGLGSVGNLSGVPQNGAYGVAWSTDTVYAPTRQAVYNRVESLVTAYQAADTTLQNNINTRAPLASPALTGTPTAPNPATNTNSTQIQTAAGVINFLGDNAVAKTITNLAATNTTLANTTFSTGSVSGNVTGSTQPVTTNNTTLATTAFSHLASVVRRITVNTQNQVNLTNPSTFTTFHVVSGVTPRDANSRFLIVGFFNVRHTNSTGEIRITCGATQVGFLNISDTSTTRKAMTIIGDFFPGNTTPFDVSLQIRWVSGTTFNSETGNNSTIWVIEYNNTI